MTASKRCKLILFTFVFLVIIQNTCYADDIAERTIKIAGDNNYPPYEYVDKSGTYKGFNVDIMHAIAIEMKLDIEIIPMEWDDTFVALQNGEVDLIQGMLKTEEREKRYSFSDKLVSSTQVIFVNKDQNNIFELSDLNGLRVSTQLGDVGEKIIENTHNIISVLRENQELAMLDLLNNSVDAMVGNRLTGLYTLQKSKQFDKIKIVGDPLYSIDYCSAVIKGNDEILDIINRGITAIKENGTYDKIYNKWFGEYIIDRDLQWKRRIEIIIAVLIVVLFSLGFVFYWNRLLKNAVFAKTSELTIANESLKSKQLSLERSNRLNGRILDNTIDGIIVLNQDGTIIASNQVAVKLLSDKLHAGMNLFSTDYMSADLHNGFLQACNGYVWKKEIDIKSDNDSAIKNVECIFSQIKEPNGNIESILFTIHDLTESKHLKEALYRSDKMRALGTMAAEVAHELRNPLTSMKMFIDMLPAKFSDEKFRKEAVNILSSEMVRLTDITKALLDYTKQRKINPTLFDFSDIINDTKTLLHSSLRQHNINMLYDCKNIMIYADKNQIEQVIVNIVINCIDAIKQDGNIWIECSSAKHISSIIVRDDGCGIAKEDIENVFDPFFTRKKSGYGLGLSICYRLIKENNGDILLRNCETKKGTEVVIELPSSEEESI